MWYTVLSCTHALKDIRNPQYRPTKRQRISRPRNNKTNEKNSNHALVAEGDQYGNMATPTRPRSHRPPTRQRPHKNLPRLCTKARVVSKQQIQIQVQVYKFKHVIMDGKMPKISRVRVSVGCLDLGVFSLLMWCLLAESSHHHKLV